MLQDKQNEVLGTTRVFLQQKECASGECNLGNFYTDAMVHAFLRNYPFNNKNWSNVSLALTTQGNFRVPLQQGNLTYGQLIAMCPWENKLIALTLSGRVIRRLLEDSVAPMSASTDVTPRSSRFLQLSGFRVKYNISKPISQRIVALKVRCTDCLVPHYEPIVEDNEYRVVVMEYLANGKNGHTIISENAKDFVIGSNDLDAFIAFMQSNEPITVGIEGRIKIIT